MANVYVLTVKIHSITSGSAKGANFSRVWNEMVKEGIDVGNLRNSLCALRPVVRRVERIRHKRTAHHEVGAKVPRVLQSEMPELLSGLKRICMDTGLQLGTIFNFDLPDADVHTLLKRLED